MSVALPTSQEVSDTIVAQISASIGQTVPLLPKAVIRVLAKVLAGVVVILYKYIGWLALQMFVEDATLQETTIGGKRISPLRRWGRLIGAGDPNPATRSELVVTATAKVQTGSVTAGTKLSNEATGVVYEVIVDQAVNASTIPLHIRAVSSPNNGNGTGSIGNLEVGDTVSFVSATSNVLTDCTVSAVTSAGEDAETEIAYRRRVLQYAQQKPQGGAYADYRIWAQSVPGIVNAYPYAGLPGEVDIFCEATFESSGSVDGFPTSDQLEAVRIAINQDVAGLATRRPVNALPHPKSITRISFTVQILTLDPDTAETRAAILDGVKEHLASREPFIEGLSVLPSRNRVTEAAISGIVDSIVAAHGATVNKVTVTPGAAYTLEFGEKAKLNGDILYA